MRLQMKFMRFLYHPVSRLEITCTKSQEKFESKIEMFVLYLVGYLSIYFIVCLPLFFFVLGFFGKFVVCSTVVVLVTDGSHHFAKKVTL